jgi:hypothetical protein
VNEYRDSVAPEPFEKKLGRVLTEKLRTVCSTPERWTKAVLLMRDARALKELLLKSAVKDRMILDLLDLKEKRALEVIYGNFRFLVGDTQKVKAELFDKNKFDLYMEKTFGSINQPSSNPVSYTDARTIFSLYLARKVWCLVPWEKFSSATNSFFERVTVPIEKPMDMRACNIAREVLKILLDGDETEARKFDPAPQSACLERSRDEGGKRFALLANGKARTSYVKPVSIYTGGKIRTITKDSAKFVKYNWINKFLGSQFRKLKCSVFGGDVQEWWDKSGGLKPQEGEFFCSGDLESATDLFDGRITSVLIEDIGKRFKMSAKEVKEMKSFTTQAYFDPKHRIKQRRGQLMGSVISFPLLCILSLTAYLYGHEEVGKLFTKKGKGFLYKLTGVGINGDDIVFAGSQERIEKWTKGVAAIGGVVSRGKTLVNRNYFTVNSELWNSNGKVNCARPSIITALTGDNRYFISPQFEWKEYRKSLLSDEARRIFDLERKLKINIPRSLGGLGLESRFDPDQMFDAYCRTQIEREFSHVVLSKPAFIEEQRRLKMKLQTFGPKFECWISKEMDLAYSKIYNSYEFNFRLNVNEIHFCLEALLAGPVPYLEHARHMFENVRFPKIDDLCLDFVQRRSHIIAALERDYDDLMDREKKMRKIPIGLMRAFQAETTDEQLSTMREWLDGEVSVGVSLPQNVEYQRDA